MWPGPTMAAGRRISRDDVAHVAHLARLDLTDEELDLFTEQLAAVLEHAADVEPPSTPPACRRPPTPCRS